MVLGVLSRQELFQAFETGMLTSRLTLLKSQIQPASIDLRPGPRVTRVKAGFLPDECQSIEEVIEKVKAHDDFSLHEDRTRSLYRHQTYVTQIEEMPNLPNGYIGAINPKSTTGRCDVMTRVLVDGVRNFDTVLPGRQRKMFLEITPLSFNVRINRRTLLSQLRIECGNAAMSKKELEKQYCKTPLLYDCNGKPIPEEKVRFRNGGIEMTADLGAKIVAYRAKPNSLGEIDLSGERGSQYKERWQFFEAIERPKNGELILEDGWFYLLATKEKARFPPHLCGTLQAYDVTSAEGRVHYAGFFDPGFFAAATLEVRVHYAPFRIVDGQPICTMHYPRMRSIPRDDKGRVSVYGPMSGSHYQNQPRGPNLPKQFQNPAA